MEQQQFKVSFSVGTKLLLSIVLLLALVILFLNASTILLVKEDKRAYIYQSQATASALAGREFIMSAEHGLDTLRVALGTVDPRAPVTPAQTSALKSLVDNQSELLDVSVALLDLRDFTLTSLAQAGRDQDLATQKIDPATATATLTPEWLKEVAPELQKSGFAFVNLSQAGSGPVTAIIAADLKLASNLKGLPIAYGLLPLQGYASQLGDLNLTIATRSGWALYDSDPVVLYSRKNVSDDPLFIKAVESRVSSGATEYDLHRTHYLGSYSQPGMDLVALTRNEWRQAISSTYTLTEKFILLGAMAIGGAVIFGILFSKTLTAPINRLYEATGEVAKGNFELELEPGSHDEIGALTGSFNVMSKKISQLIAESMERVRLENELAIASTVQQTLIPPERLSTEKVYIRSHYQSASECGGDWWGYFGVGNHLCMIIADATGHGLPSALITASARSCFSVMHKLAGEDPEFSFSPSAMLAFANRVVFDASMAKIMMTMFVGVIDFDRRTLTYSSAGHNPPWLFKRGDGGYSLKSLVTLGKRLGEDREVNDFEEKSMEIGEQDILFLYTDGLTEGKDVKGEMYGKKRARKLVEAGLAGGPESVIDGLLDDFLKYNEGKALDDDVTLAAAMIFPPAGLDKAKNG